ncbi:DUF3298 and DUF4163 domain-containing protein [Allomuricauda sp. SCSIO 65647]|uniref:DUF3298 and DUF4163 domain-containing protein n=1 Tax=Allomuricauda sp. SCSIO 65647 TaxID=2908843 RepID=UPI001F369690|nr:DUF3298 and DUF4163 domain-containing protein [Muricauda sp. SCSIO 65647]UJH66060.1 DUF3298 and DUF4163 domain-containing protein [Muricauda sp. SCSIO 65647]
MKKVFFTISLLIAFISCKESHKLTFEPLEFSGADCHQCPKIKIQIPHALNEDKLAATISTALREEIIYHLRFDEGSDVATIDGAIASFTKEFQQVQQKFADESLPWEAEINAEIIFEDDNLLTIMLNSYIFTGGAHGNGSTTLLNFDKNNNQELENHELFSDLEGFEKLAEVRFREQESIPKEGDINQTGFMFERNRFHLAENIAYTEQGLQMIYNQYEIASYADGPITLIIPFKEAAPYLKHKVKS